ncbi:hypothetical protein GR211_16720 [Rhizobium leguminosarum]|uniref:restriction endonuclease subunit S n=1 Tax=Rhizobium ruizarguesonis TaxID=2081791 RepID=UPI0013BC86D8|nr:restriction endonuclease subunit S [Rhizobium ruizarguesonis]NEJ14179.1 hypothetical protein [Rhizobium ruizarguesonis]NEK28551.1 hypothetical protein [Rhizobium ruizarguesonis]
MSREVPDGWRTVDLGDVAKESRSRNSELSISEERLVGVFKDQGMVPMRERVRGTSVERCKVVRPGDFAYNPMRINIGSIARSTADANLMVSPDYVVFSPDTNKIDGLFLDCLRKSEAWAAFVGNAGDGGVRIRIYFEHLARFRFNLPPLHEQSRIAEILSSIDEAIVAMRAVIEQTGKIKQSVLERLLTKGIGHARFKQTEIGEIPEGWEVGEVQEHFHVQLGKMLSKAAKVGSSPSPYLRNANVQWGRIDTEDLLHMDFSEQEKQKFRLQRGDLLVCEGGDVGRCAIWNDGQEMYYQKALHRLREKTGVVRNQFLMYVLVRIFTSKALSAGLVGTNSIAHFTREQFLRLKFPVPDADEQNAICETLEALDASTRENISKQEALLTLKSALTSDLLTGRKRVTNALPMAAE